MKVFMCCLCLALLALHVFAPDVMASAGAGGGLPYEDWLTKLSDSVTGPYALAVSLIGIVVAGTVLIFGGDLNGVFRTFVTIILIISIIIGSKNMMTSFFGQGSVIASTPIAQVWVA